MSSGDCDSENVSVRDLPANNRTEEITKAFTGVFNKKPDFYVRVPGRVNLIGEHIDYCGYSVCPMALEQDVLLAVSTSISNQKLQLHNVDAKYESFECDLQNIEITLPEGAPQWYQYFLCGVKGIIEVLPKDVDIKGMGVVVSGNVPQGAGLSSSSALVSAAALATAYGHKFSLSKEKLASLCGECEKYIGTQGGGMDQAIAFLATEEHHRERRVTCDVLSISIKGVQLNHALCAANCIRQKKKGGWCDSRRVCNCRN